MLPKKKRLTTKLFEVVMAKGRVYHSPHLTLRLYRLSPQEPGRFSFVVSKKVALKASDRNTLKRRMAHAFKKNQNMLASSYHGIFFAKKSVLECGFEEIAHEIQVVMSAIQK